MTSDGRTPHAVLSTSASSLDGDVTIRGVAGFARHGHAEAPARLAHASFEVDNRRGSPLTLEVERVELLAGAPARGEEVRAKAEPTAAGILVEESTQRASSAAVEIPPRARVRALVGFAPAVEAYQAWGDVFAFRVTFRAAGERMTATAETSVVRATPRRP